ncbi:MAG: hypothetical protein QGF68_17485, partial [Nitrospinota bacterium]|nr:hypothetical protein [Nitrospinota bacterium]
MKAVQRISKWVAYLLLPIFIVTCATTNLPPLSLNPKQPLESDESRIWQRSAEEQKRVNRRRRTTTRKPEAIERRADRRIYVNLEHQYRQCDCPPWEP